MCIHIRLIYIWQDMCIFLICFLDILHVSQMYMYIFDIHLLPWHTYTYTFDIHLTIYIWHIHIHLIYIWHTFCIYIYIWLTCSMSRKHIRKIHISCQMYIKRICICMSRKHVPFSDGPRVVALSIRHTFWCAFLDTHDTSPLAMAPEWLHYQSDRHLTYLSDMLRWYTTRPLLWWPHSGCTINQTCIWHIYLICFLDTPHIFCCDGPIVVALSIRHIHMICFRDTRHVPFSDGPIVVALSIRYILDTSIWYAFVTYDTSPFTMAPRVARHVPFYNTPRVAALSIRHIYIYMIFFRDIRHVPLCDGPRVVALSIRYTIDISIWYASLTYDTSPFATPPDTTCLNAISTRQMRPMGWLRLVGSIKL